MYKQIVVTGLGGVVSPVGNDMGSFWEAICEGKSGADKISRSMPQVFQVKLPVRLRDLNLVDSLKRRN